MRTLLLGLACVTVVLPLLTFAQTDIYGGSTSLPSPNTATGNWRTEKIGSQWWFIDPLNNAFHFVAPYNVGGGDGLASPTGTFMRSIIYAKYSTNSGNWPCAYLPSVVGRLKQWKFTALGGGSQVEMLPIRLNGCWGTGDSYPPQQYRMPFVLFFPTSTYAMSNTYWNTSIWYLPPGQSPITQPVKNFNYGINSNIGYGGWLPAVGEADFYDARLYSYFNYLVLNHENAQQYWVSPSAIQSYVVGAYTDEADEMYSFTTAGSATLDNNHTHGALRLLKTSPLQTANRMRSSIYPDAKLYTKATGFRNYINGKYATIAALNTAWGSSYSACDMEGAGNDFGSCGTQVSAEAFATANGSSSTYTHTLAQAIPSWHSVSVYVGGAMVAGDLGYNWWEGDIYSVPGTPPSGPSKFYGPLVDSTTSTINYTSATGTAGTCSITFKTGSAYGASILGNGSTVTVKTQTQHGSWPGAHISIAGTTNYNVTGVVIASVVDSYTFTISNAATGATEYGGTVSFTDSAPPNGTPITVSYVKNGWGIGNGLMDEDGRHTGWLGDTNNQTNAVDLSLATAGGRADIESFIGQMATQYFSNMATIFGNRFGNGSNRKVLNFGPDPLIYWASPSHAGVLQAAGQYTDVIGVQSYMDGRILSQTQLDYIRQYAGDKPLLNVDYEIANPDSAIRATPNPASGGFAFAATQAARGSAYFSNIQQLSSFAYTNGGSKPFVGTGFWQWVDSMTELKNFGLLTPYDNAYDGHEDVTGSVTCSAPINAYTCGGDQYNSGNFITAATSANALWQPSLGGQSLQTSTTYASANMTALSHSVSSRVEFYVHDWVDNPTAYSIIAYSNAQGVNAYFMPNGGTAAILVGDLFSSGANCTIPLAAASPKGAYVRYQRNFATLIDTCEAWDTFGVRFWSGSWAISGDNPLGGGVQVGGTTGETRNVGFFRIFSDLVPVNSKMPVFADTSSTRLLEWKFEGNLNDSGSGGNLLPATMSSGSATYVATQYQNVIAVAKTSGAPTWSNWTSFRAGFPGQLDGSGSISESEATSTASCFWQQLSGPSTLSWSSHTNCSPTLTGLIFGGYKLQLTASDANGKAITTLDVGAVATDSNGVVVNADPNADLIYGPMIAFGKNPWQYQDERALFATTARSAYYTAANLDSNDPVHAPSWAIPLPGTVSYPVQPVATTLCGAVASATTLSLTVCTVQNLDLTTFPTHVMLGSPGKEEVVVTGTTGTSGTQTLTVAYDGRGFATGMTQHVAAQAWANGSPVTQQKITGSGTTFLSTFTPAGAGLQGLLSYNTGTVTATAGSAVITGAGGANWTSQNLCNIGAGLCYLAIRISGTHAATPFAFFAFVNTLDSSTQVTLNRPFPSDADTAAGLTYAFIGAKQDGTGNGPALHYARTDNVAYPYDGITLSLFTSACETDTACYVYAYSDPASYSPTNSTCLGFSSMQCGKHYGQSLFYSHIADAAGPNYYDEGLAHMALYKRSGWQPALDAFRKIEGSDVGADPTKVGWMWYPENAQGDVASHPRQSSVTGAVVAAIMDGKASNWPAIRTFASKYSYFLALATGCNSDLREESAYPYSWLTLAALLDPDPTQQAAWTTALGSVYTFDLSCIGSGSALKTDSHPNSTWNNNQSPALTATNGSAVMTASTPIPAQMCPMIATGSDASVTNGSDVVTSAGSLFVVNPCGTAGPARRGKIMFFGDAINPILSFNYILDSSSQIHLSGMYPGTTATSVRWQIDCAIASPTVTSFSAMSIGASGSDTQLDKNWACVLSNGGLTMTLDRAWDGPTGTVWPWHGAIGGVYMSGRGTSPFILGIKTFQMSYGAKMAGSLGANYHTLAANAATWIKTYGIDTVSGGTHYARIFPMCEPIYAESSQPQNFWDGWRNPGCSYNGANTANAPIKPIARTNLGEVMNAARVSYEADGSGANKTFWDTVYNNVWGATGLTNLALYTDGITAGSLDNSVQYGLSGGKWPGFFFGIGMSHQWPAARLGGVAAAVNRSILVGYSLASVANATVFQIVLTTPSGKTTTVACSGSPCTVTGDARQGAHLMSLVYRNAGNKIVAQSSQPIGLAVQ